MTLQEVRHARKLTQVRMAKALGIGQDGVSKLEKRADLMISTLRKTWKLWAAHSLSSQSFRIASP